MITINASSVNKLRRFDADILGISIPSTYSGLENYKPIKSVKPTKTDKAKKPNKKP